VDPDKIKGDVHQSYNKPQEDQEASDKIDPEKFKKVMKVDESEETQKRKKRNLSREEEEGEDETAVEETPKSPGSFSEFMSDKEELDSVFDKQSGGVRRQAAPQEDPFIAPPKESTSTDGVEVDEGAEPPPISQTTMSAPIEQSSESPDQNPPKKEKRDKEETANKKEEDTSLLASQPKKSELEALKKKPKTGPAPEIKIIPEGKEPTEKKDPVQQDVIDKPSAFLHTPTPPSKEKVPGTLAKKPDANILPIDEAFSGEQSNEKGPEERKKEGVAPTHEKDKQVSLFKRFTPQEVRNQKMGKEATTSPSYEGLAIPPSTESEQGEMGGQGKKKDDQTFIEASSDTAGIPLPTFDNPVSSVIPSAETPAYSKLSTEMHELFEKIGGVILVQQEKGVTTTTVNVNMPNSVFDGTQMILDQYSTAPNSYNIQLVGNPESVKVFNQNLDALRDSFKQANFNFEVNIQNPILTRGKKPSHLIRRKGSGGEKKQK
jgi:hypothetical protein